MLGEMDPCSQTRGEIWKKRCSGDIVHFFKSVNEEMIHPMKDVKLQPQQFRKKSCKQFVSGGIVWVLQGAKMMKLIQ